MLRIALVVPFDPIMPSNPSFATQPPLRLAYLAAVTRQLGHQTTVIDGVGLGYEQRWPFGSGFVLNGLTFDQIIDRIPQDVDVVGVSMLFTQTYPPIKALIGRIKNNCPQALTVLGGEGVSGIADFMIQDCDVDAIVVGEGENAWAQILERTSTGQPIDSLFSVVLKNSQERPVHDRIRQAGPYDDLDALPFPDWSDIPLERYWKHREGAAASSHGVYLPVAASRGCPYKCRFCTASTTWGRQRYRSAENVIAELKTLVQRYGIRSVTFNDLSISTDRTWFQDFVEKMLESELDLEWNVPTGIRAYGLRRDLLQKAADSGLNYVQIAPETGSPKVMEWLKKKLPLEYAEQTAAYSKAIGIPVGAYLIVGTPVEDLDEFLATQRLLRRLAKVGVDEVSVSVLVAHPGSPFFNELKGTGQLVFNDAFFLGLSQADFHRPVSYSPHFSGKKIQVLRLYALAWFYLWSFFYHPGKLVSLVRNIVSNNTNTKLVRVFRHRIGAVLLGFAPLFSLTSMRMFVQIVRRQFTRKGSESASESP